MKIVTFNVNGVRARMDTLIEWLKRSDPEVVALQEIKIQDIDFPRSAFEKIGYHCYLNGQKSFNGVAILTKEEAKLSSKVLPGDSDDKQARFIEVYYKKRRFICIYLPNGNPKDTEKFSYKLGWMDRLNEYCRRALKDEEEIVVLGDFNVIPQYNDCKYPERWTEDALFSHDVRAKFNYLLNLGYLDAIRILDESASIFTQWDYRDRAWEENNGVRIDHILLSPNAADKLEDSWVDTTLRDQIKPSDHVPVWALLSTK
tara:strand:+ start:2557 stop:3330 length:774 start_codon:yes stop_codon:yes gene_type:complete